MNGKSETLYKRLLRNTKQYNNNNNNNNNNKNNNKTNFIKISSENLFTNLHTVLFRRLKL